MMYLRYFKIRTWESLLITTRIQHDRSTDYSLNTFYSYLSETQPPIHNIAQSQRFSGMMDTVTNDRNLKRDQ